MTNDDEIDFSRLSLPFFPLASVGSQFPFGFLSAAWSQSVTQLSINTGLIVLGVGLSFDEWFQESNLRIIDSRVAAEKAPLTI